MTYPRELLSGSTYLVTRRCTQRQFLLLPDREVNKIFLYCLATAAERFSVQVHAVCVMSGHWHGIVTDLDGELPDFMAWVHKYVAKCMNARLGRWENFWSSSRYSAVRLESSDDVMDKIVYVLTNPVAAHLVSRSHMWPGLHTARAAFGGKPMEADRPGVYFRKDGLMPAGASLFLKRPPGFSRMSNSKFTAEVKRRVQEMESMIQADCRARGRSFLGRKACLKYRRTYRPRSREPRREISPRIAARDMDLRIEALFRLSEFVGDYRLALDKWKNGIRNVLFPAGTYWLRKHFSVRCREPAS